MKRLVVALFALALVGSTSICDDSDKAWLDMQNCALCQPMAQNMDMMAHVTWENHKISNGSLSASVVPKEYAQRMDDLHEEMVAMGKRLEQGEAMKLCGFCDSHCELKEAGAKEELVKTDFGMIALLTSDDPELVKKIHAHSDKTNEEFKKFLASQAKP